MPRSRPEPFVVEGVRIPAKLVSLLRETFTEKGVQQWLKSRNRYLKRKTPLWHLKQGHGALVLQAAHAYAEGSYI